LLKGPLEEVAVVEGELIAKVLGMLGMDFTLETRKGWWRN
jgi:hypothetical protein